MAQKAAPIPMRKTTTETVAQNRGALSGTGLLLLAALCGCADAPVAPPPPTPATPADEQAVLSLEQQWCDAFRGGDSAAIARIEDDGYTYSGLNDDTGTRADDLAQIRNRSIEYSRYENREQTTRLDGAVIVVTGISALEGMAGDRPFKMEVRFTDTFSRRDGEWKATARRVATLTP
jgi:ketosteroid isomerase-like protein